MPTSKTEILNSTFQSVFTVEDKTSLPALPESTHPSIEAQNLVSLLSYLR